MIILSMYIALTGCSKDNDDAPKPQVTSNGIISLASAESWFYDAKALQDLGYDPQVMVIIFSLDNIPTECSTEDIAAVFVGDQCRYAANVQTYNGKPYAAVVVYRTVSDGSQPLTFSIRYYSKKEMGYFTSTPFSFETDETLGTLTNPTTITWMK